MRLQSILAVAPVLISGLALAYRGYDGLYARNADPGRMVNQLARRAASDPYFAKSLVARWAELSYDDDVLEARDAYADEDDYLDALLARDAEPDADDDLHDLLARHAAHHDHEHALYAREAGQSGSKGRVSPPPKTGPAPQIKKLMRCKVCGKVCQGALCNAHPNPVFCTEEPGTKGALSNLMPPHLMTKDKGKKKG